jgi:colanic acid/amylovoran biosynthesis glycosyltransferase
MHVLQIIPHFPPESFLVEHLHALHNNTIDIKFSWFYLGSKHYGEHRYISEHLVHEVGLFTKKQFSLRHRIAKKIKGLDVDGYIRRYNVEQVKKINPDIIHFQFGWSLAKFHWIIDELNLPYFISFRGSDIFVEPHINADYIESIKPYVIKAKGIHVVSISVKKKVIEWFNPSCPIYQINTPIRIHQEELQGNNPERNTIITVGRLHWVKDYQELLLAFKQFSEKRPEVKLKIIGDGPEAQKLIFMTNKLGLSSRVQFLGNLNRKEIDIELQSAKAFVLTSLSEGFPNALLEALMLGVNCIVPDDLEIDKVFSNGEVDYYEKFNPSDLARKILNIFNENIESQKIKIQNARTVIKQEFSFEKHNHAFSEMYKSVEILVDE